MTSVFEDGALHPGRDPNDSWWLVVRRAEDWGALPPELSFDPARQVVELAPAALAGDEPPGRVVAPDGTEYTSAPRTCQILRRRPCDPAATPLPGLGGCGVSTGRFRDPAGLALDDRGFLYVADRDNHRVQVIDLATCQVEVVLGATDPWGRPAAGDGRGQLDRPVAVAVGASRVFVGCAGGRIAVYDRAFRFDRAFVATRPGAGAPADIVALAADGDTVLVVDRAHSAPERMSCTGADLGGVALDQLPASLAWLAGRARFALEGAVVVGPFDGGVDQQAWHEVVVDAELPPGTRVEVQTFAADADPAVPPAPPPGPPLLPAATPWAPAEPVALPLAGAEPARGEIARPVLSDTGRWQRQHGAPYLRGAVVERFAGDGPNAVAVLSLAPAAARMLRAGDDVAFEAAGAAGGSPEPATVLDVGPHTATLAAAGTFQIYPDHTTLTLIERGGRALDPTVIGALTGADVIDLSGFAGDGDVRDVALPHTAAALLLPGDVVDLWHGGHSARLWIDALWADPVLVQLDAPLLGDFSDGTLRLTGPAGRLVTGDATSWAGGFPPGDRLAVAWDDSGTVREALLTVSWSDPDSATVWTTTAAPTTWLSFAPADPARATDRGRWLWVKLRLVGARARPTDELATATPTIHRLRLVAPRLSYLSYLPAVYARRDDDDPSGALFLERFLALFEGRLTSIEGRYEDVARMVNPAAADDDWLGFVAAWFALAFDPSWSRARRARLVSEIFELYRRRGTAEGLRRAVEIYTGHRPEVIEGFQVRPRAGAVLGACTVLGCAPLGGLDPAAASDPGLLDAYAHRFTVVATVDDDCDLDVAQAALAALIDAVKPAHTLVDLRVSTPRSRVGLESMVGIDFVLGDGRPDTTAPLGTAGPGAAGPGPVLGVSAALGPRGGLPMSRTPTRAGE